MIGKSNQARYVLVIIAVFIFSGGCDSSSSSSSPETLLSSQAYKGHENDVDMNFLVQAYPSVRGTRLDDCHTCHSGEVDDDGIQVGNACDYCHEMMLEEVGHSFQETLNSYGNDYLGAGRDLAALGKIKDQDSDGDTYPNEEEILDSKYPGSSQSQPGQAVAPLLTVTVDQLKAMPAHSEFLLVNTKKQQFDHYTTYKGVRIIDLLAGLNIDLNGVTGITVIAPDGFQRSQDIEAITEQFPDAIFDAGLDVGSLGPDCGFVEYPQPEAMPGGLTDLGTIPDQQWLMIAYERDGEAMDSSYLDVISGHIEGEGPLRLIVPQSEPGLPDRGSKHSPRPECNDGYDYDQTRDHNGGHMVRGVIAIRIDPMPEGMEEFDYVNGGWSYIDSNQLIIYGRNVE